MPRPHFVQPAALSLLAFFVSPLAAAPAAEEVFKAIRDNNLNALKIQLQDSSTPSVRGRFNNTPLHVAASSGSIEAIRLLIEAGADINARNALEFTPVILSAWDLDRTRLLVEKGADVNAAAKNGRTALIVAAGLPGGAETAAYLLSKGANPLAKSSDGATPLIAAAGTHNSSLVEALLARGANVNDADAEGYTPLMNAAGRASLPNVKLLLRHGANPNAANTGGGQVRHGDIALKQLTALMLAAPFGDTELAKELVAAGANVNAKDVRGMTPLMLAIASDNAKPRTVEYLLSAGARLDEKSTDGETALDWARKYGNPAIISLLVNAGAKSGGSTAVAAGAAKPAKDARESALKALELLQAANASFFKESGCFACHNQNAAAPALRMARAHGLPINEAAAQAQVRSLDLFVGVFQPMLWVNAPVPGRTDTVTSLLTGLAALDAPAGPLTDSMVHYVATAQLADGSFGAPFGISRPPLEESDITRTAAAIKAMTTYSWPARKPEFDQRISRARHYLLEAKPITNYERAERILGLVWSGAPKQTIERAVRELAAAQHPSGGWQQTATLAPDAFATGLALQALRESGLVRITDKTYRDGVAYLVKTQHADGSWHVASRSVKFQPYFESGFPHGHDQWISLAATSQAVSALAPATVSVKSARAGR